MAVTKIDLHGFTLEEATKELDREINHLFCEEPEERRMEIVTGRGDVLNPRIREYLQKHPLVKDIRVGGASIGIILEDLN